MGWFILGFGSSIFLSFPLVAFFTVKNSFRAGFTVE